MSRRSGQYCKTCTFPSSGSRSPTAFSPLDSAWIPGAGMLVAPALGCPRETGSRDASIRNCEGLS